MKRRVLILGAAVSLLSGISSAEAVTKKPKVKPTPTPKPTPKATPKPSPVLSKAEYMLLDGESFFDASSLIAPVVARGNFIKDGYSLPIMIAMPRANVLRVFTARCPHQGYLLNLPKDGKFTCDQHGASFDSDSGKVLSGPTISNLEMYEAVIRDNRIFIKA